MSPLSVNPMTLQNWYRCVPFLYPLFFCYITNHSKCNALKQTSIIYSLCCLGISGWGQWSQTGWSCYGAWVPSWDGSTGMAGTGFPGSLVFLIRLRAGAPGAMHKGSPGSCLVQALYQPFGQSKSGHRGNIPAS